MPDDRATRREAGRGTIENVDLVTVRWLLCSGAGDLASQYHEVAVAGHPHVGGSLPRDLRELDRTDLYGGVRSDI